MRIKLNPIVKKDLKVSARSMRFSWSLFAYEAILTLAFLLVLVVIQEDSQSFYSSSNVYSDLVPLFPVIAIVQLCIVALIVPIITASSISGEKERQTFDIMLTTCMSPLAIVMGKVISAVLRILLFVIGSLPIMALSFVVGGMKWSNLVYYVLAITLLSIISGSIGILCSAFSNKSITAVILSFCVYFGIYGLTFIPFLIKLFSTNGNRAGESLLFLLFNPGVFFEEFFMHMLTDENAIFSNTPFPRKSIGAISYFLMQGKRWMFASAICILLLSFGFMLLAAWKVNPMHSSKGKRRKKKKGEN